MRRVPLRARVSLAFVLASAAVLVALAVFLHQRLAAELDASVQAGLRQRAGDLAAQDRAGARLDLSTNTLVERGDDLAQLLDARGSVLEGATGFESRPLLDPGQARAARRGPLLVRRTPLPGDDEFMTLVAAPAGDRVIVVGASLEQRDDALAKLDGLLAVGVPIAIALAGLTGFFVAGRALAPLRRIRTRAERIGAVDLAERLPVPVARDEIHRLAETLNAMLARLEQGFAREQAFVADASHELRTPLARLKAELELASSPGRTAPELTAAVRSSAEEVDRLARPAEDLLVLARVDQGQLPIRPELVAAGALLADVARRFGVDHRCPAGLTLEADRLRLEQALTNLADNALRHGGAPVTLAARAEDGEVIFSVQDAGPGFAAELRERAFERFTRGDAARSEGGAGLGLAIVAAVAHAHGGAAGIAHGAPSSVWLALPAG